MSPGSAGSLVAGRYRLDYLLATDRLSEVWRGTDIELARPVAVKVLRAKVGDETVSQFRAAACRAGSLTHEGLVQVFDYCEPEPSDSTRFPFMVMEYVDGQSLAGQLRAGPIETGRTIDIVAQVSAALRAVHRAALAHGDIRPEKILLTGDGMAKLFGFSGTCPSGPTAIGADLRALGNLARGCLAEGTRSGDSGGVAGQLPAPIADLVAELCTCESAHADATAAIARRAAALRPQFARSAPQGPGPARSTGSVQTDSTQPLPAVRTGMRGGVVALRAAAVLAILVAVALYGAFRPSGTAPGAQGVAVTASVRVTAARLVGRPVDVVRIRLRQLGLVVRVRWRESDSVKAGDVITVWPVGLVPAHSVIVVVGSSGRPTASAIAGFGQAHSSHRQRKKSRSASHSPGTKSPTPGPSRSPSQSPTPTPSPSPSSSPAPSPSPTSSPPPSSTPPQPNPTAG